MIDRRSVLTGLIAAPMVVCAERSLVVRALAKEVLHSAVAYFWADDCWLPYPPNQGKQVRNEIWANARLGKFERGQTVLMSNCGLPHERGKRGDRAIQTPYRDRSGHPNILVVHRTGYPRIGAYA